MNRSEWKKRLVDAEIPEEVVDDLLSTIKDEDLARMKDMSTEQILQTMKDTVAESEDETPVEEKEAEDTTPEPSMVEMFATLKDSVLTQIAEQLNTLEIEVEAPQIKEMAERLVSLEATITTLHEEMKELRNTWSEVLRGDAERLKEMTENLSPAQRVRLRGTLSDGAMSKRIAEHLKDRGLQPKTDVAPESDFRRLGQLPVAKDGDIVYRDASGQQYANLQDMAVGRNPIK